MEDERYIPVKKFVPEDAIVQDLGKIVDACATHQLSASYAGRKCAPGNCFRRMHVISKHFAPNR